MLDDIHSYLGGISVISQQGQIHYFVNKILLAHSWAHLFIFCNLSHGNSRVKKFCGLQRQIYFLFGPSRKVYGTLSWNTGTKWRPVDPVCVYSKYIWLVQGDWLAGTWESSARNKCQHVTLETKASLFLHIFQKGICFSIIQGLFYLENSMELGM